jgi:hypothetical protein
MFTPNLHFDGFSIDEWMILRDLLSAQLSRPASPSLGGLIAVHSDRSLRKLLHTRRGRLDTQAQPWPVPLVELCRQNEASWAIALEFGVLDELLERFADKVYPRQTYLEQMLELFRIFRELEATRRIELWPGFLNHVPAPSTATVERFLNALCPDGRVVLLGVFEGGELCTSIAMRRRGLGFDQVVGPELLRPEMGLLSGDFRRDHPHLIRAVERQVGPVALGCFGPLAKLREVTSATRPGAWSSAVVAGEIIVSPAVPVVAVPFGLDIGRAFLFELRQATERLAGEDFAAVVDPVRWVSKLSRFLRDKVG